MKQGLTDSGFEQQPVLDEAYGEEAYAAAEHISIGEDASAPPAAPNEVVWRRMLAGPEPGRSTEITYFREGWLRLRTGSRNGVDAEQLVELCFIDPKFSGDWRLHRFWLWISAVALACLPAIWLAGSLDLLFPLAGEATVSPLLVSVILAAVTAASGLTMLVRTARRSVTFVTRTGRVPAVHLIALPGKRQKIKAIARDIRTAIRKTPTANAEESGDLRAEMQGHYRLRDAGVISAELCDEGTRRILAQFG